MERRADWYLTMWGDDEPFVCGGRQEFVLSWWWCVACSVQLWRVRFIRRVLWSTDRPVWLSTHVWWRDLQQV